MPGVRTLLSHVLGERIGDDGAQTHDAPSLIEVPAYRIPKTLINGDADLGVWWDTQEPVGLERTTMATSDLIVVTNADSILPRRPLVPADLHDQPLVGFGGLGHHLLEEFCHRMAAAGSLVRFGNPKLPPDPQGGGAYMLTPGSPAASELDPDLTILPLAQPIEAKLIVAARLETDTPQSTDSRSPLVSSAAGWPPRALHDSSTDAA